MDRVEPSRTSFRMENPVEIRIEDLPVVEKALPKRENERTDRLEPTEVASRIESAPPNLPAFRRDTEEPN